MFFFFFFFPFSFRDGFQLPGPWRDAVIAQMCLFSIDSRCPKTVKAPFFFFFPFFSSGRGPHVPWAKNHNKIWNVESVERD